MTTVALIAACAYTAWCTYRRASDVATMHVLGSYANDLDRALRSSGCGEEADLIAAAHDLQHEGTNP